MSKYLRIKANLVLTSTSIVKEKYLACQCDYANLQLRQIYFKVHRFSPCTDYE